MNGLRYGDKVVLDNASKERGTIIGWGFYMRLSKAEDKPQVAALIALEQPRYLYESDGRERNFISVLAVDVGNLRKAT